MSIVSNGYILDEHVENTLAELLLDGSSDPYTCVLNQTNIKSNQNKFYIMHALKTSSGFCVFTRYGRIGERGVIGFKPSSSETDAISSFKTQFRTKTKNPWDKRDSFVIHPGKYFLTSLGEKIDMSSSESDVISSENEDVPKHVFDQSVEFFLNLISNKTMLSQALASMDIDVKKMPLGKINKENINKARAILTSLSASLTSTDVSDLSSKYYMYIPYACGRKIPPIIDSKAKIDCLLDKLDDLENISINMTLQKSSLSSADPMLDLYKSLGTEISPVPKDARIFSEISKYIKNSHGSSHRFKLEIHDVLAINRPDAKMNFDKEFGKIKNRELLIHGTRMSNFISILKNGLLLDPSKVGATISGKMFGYGIYWANSFSKSAQYCGHSGGRSDEKVCFILAEVAVGNQKELTDSACSMSRAGLGPHDSAWGRGRNTPSSYTVVDGVSIPNGPLCESKVPGCYLVYDEKIIYHQSQCNFKYIVTANMKY